MESSQAVQLAADSAIAGPFTFFSTAAVPQAHGVTVNQGDLNLAGRDVHVHKHYHSYPDQVDISAVLGAIRNLRTIHLDIVSKITPGTGVWLLKTEKFLVWVDLNGDLKIMWGTGIPGAGKTVLASIVIRELEARAKVAGGQICICYVYIRYSDCADLTVRNVLEILVKQTVERHPGCKILAEQAYAQHLHEKAQPTEDELLELLGQFAEATAATFYLLDALDEAPNRIQIDLVQKLASLNVRLFITSRPLKAVEAQAPNAYCFTIVAQDSDLDLHIAQKIARSRDLQGLLEEVGSSLRNEIVSQVKSKCNGMFLHASLQLDALCQCVSTREVRQTLEAFPLNIEEVYRQTWSRILEQKPTHVFLAKNMLLWVLNASRSMTIEELERAIATSPETHKFEQDRRVPGTTLITLCCGLVTLEEEGRRVRLVHYTAKDILQGLLHDSFPHPHSYLATVCMTHLTECGFQNTTIRSGEEFTAARRLDPLVAYASDAWATHAQKSLNIADTRQRTTNFVRESTAYPILIEPGVPGSFDILGPFHIAAIYNLPLSLVAQGGIGDPNVKTQIYQASPLPLASWHGHEEAVVPLLAHPDIQVNLVNDTGWSTLMMVARAGHKVIAQLLLARPDIQVNMVDNNGLSALFWAAFNGHNGIVELLLARPEVQINLVNNNGWSALMSAASNGHEGVVKLLLAHPEVQINLVDEDGWSALMLAASNSHEGIIKLLLAHPEIQINLVKNNGQSTLMLAASKGDEGIVKLLLEHPEVQINLVKNKGQSALMAAASKGREGVVKLLLAHPEVQVNLVKNDGWSALMVAASEGHEGVVKLLLAHPEVQVNLLKNDGWSALMLTASNGHEGTVKLLLAHSEVQVNLVKDDWWFSLVLAASEGHEGIVKLLLAHPEAQVNLVTSDGRSALMLAASNGHEGTVKLLLAHSKVQINLVDNDGWFALMEAASEGHEGVVKLLLAHPEVQINLVDDDGWSALMLAASEGHEGIVKLLLAHPEVQVNLLKNDGWSALMLAALNGCDSTATLLLAHPETQVNLTDNDGWTATMVAARYGHAGVVELLMAHPETLVNLLKNDGLSSLLLAVHMGHQGIVKLLLAHHAIQVNQVTAEGWSALMIAADCGYEGVLALLLAHPSTQVNLADGHGSTALLVAAEGGRQMVVERLLATGGVDVNAFDKDGDTAIRLAAEDGHEAIVRLLLDVPNIDITITSTDGHTPLSAARAKGHSAIVRLMQNSESRKALFVSPPETVQLSLDSAEDDDSDSDRDEAYHDAEERIEGDVSSTSLTAE